MPATTPPSAPGAAIERQRWERVRRALMNLVMQIHGADPTSRYTLQIEIVPKEPQPHR